MLTSLLKNNKQITILSIIFVGLRIPNIIVYAEHSLLELDESKESAEKGTINKSTRQLAEGIFFALIAIGYIITTILIFAKPNNVIPYSMMLQRVYDMKKQKDETIVTKRL